MSTGHSAPARRDSDSESPVRIGVENLAYAYDAGLDPVAEVEPGSLLVFETADARNGALSDRPAGTLFSLPPPTPGRGNPLTGPVVIKGASAGDALSAEVVSIQCDRLAWAGGHSHSNPLWPGRIPESLGRSCEVLDGKVNYGAGIVLSEMPMVGCIGTAPADSAPFAGLPGRWGGNMDHPIIATGSTVYLPVSVDGGYLFVGDVHARQGDGELSGTAFEVGAEVTLRVSLVKAARLAWPWVVTDDRIIVTASGAEFPDVRREVVHEMVQLIEQRLGLQPADALGLVSVAGDLRVGQAYGGMDMTLRLEMPRLEGLELFASTDRTGTAR